MHVLVNWCVDEEFVESVCCDAVKGGEFLLKVNEGPAPAALGTQETSSGLRDECEDGFVAYIGWAPEMSIVVLFVMLRAYLSEKCSAIV